MAVVRRTRAGLSAVRRRTSKHLHHRLLAIGHSHRTSVLIMYLWAALFAGTVVWLSIVRTPLIVLAIVTVAAVFGLLLVTMPRLRPWSRASNGDGAAPRPATVAASAVPVGTAPEPGTRPAGQPGASRRRAGQAAVPAEVAAGRAGMTPSRAGPAGARPGRQERRTRPPGRRPAAPATVPPGTAPPGTAPPGTAPLGTAPPGTASLGTALPGTAPRGMAAPAASATAPRATGQPRSRPGWRGTGMATRMCGPGTLARPCRRGRPLVPSRRGPPGRSVPPWELPESADPEATGTMPVRRWPGQPGSPAEAPDGPGNGQAARRGRRAPRHGHPPPPPRPPAAPPWA